MDYVPKFNASGAVHLMGICFSPSDTVYSSSSRDIPKSEILTELFLPTKQFRAARSLQVRQKKNIFCEKNIKIVYHLVFSRCER